MNSLTDDYTHLASKHFLRQKWVKFGHLSGHKKKNCNKKSLYYCTQSWKFPIYWKLIVYLSSEHFFWAQLTEQKSNLAFVYADDISLPTQYRIFHKRLPNSPTTSTIMFFTTWKLKANPIKTWHIMSTGWLF